MKCQPGISSLAREPHPTQRSVSLLRVRCHAVMTWTSDEGSHHVDKRIHQSAPRSPRYDTTAARRASLHHQAGRLALGNRRDHAGHRHDEAHRRDARRAHSRAARHATRRDVLPKLRNVSRERRRPRTSRRRDARDRLVQVVRGGWQDRESRGEHGRAHRALRPIHGRIRLPKTTTPFDETFKSAAIPAPAPESSPSRARLPICSPSGARQTRAARSPCPRPQSADEPAWG